MPKDISNVPASFFEYWEPEPISSLDSFIDIIKVTFSRWSEKNVQYAWRGVVNAEWALHSTLYRRMIWTHGNQTKEDQLQRIEKEILADAHRWGLHYSGESHLPILYELAMLQHFGVPTRLIDVTFNPLIALYFAVEDQKDDFGESSFEEVDGRIFVFDVSSRIINEKSTQERAWENSYDRFWADGRIEDWRVSYWAWKPAPIQERFAAQQSGFIFGGVPITIDANKKRKYWPDPPSGDKKFWGIEDVRKAVSVAVRFHRLELQQEKAQGRPPNDPTFTLRVAAKSKARIRNELRSYFGIEARTIYPDYPGFSARGIPSLHRKSYL